MARIFVERITTSIKIGAVESLGPKTLFVGNNRTGKSTRVNAIEAAGSGRVSDVAGRATLAKDADLIALAPDNADRVFAKVVFSDKTYAEWSLERGHRAKRVGPEIAFPIRDVREAILGEPDKARKWILRNGGLSDWEEVVKLVPASLRRRLEALTKETGVFGSGLNTGDALSIVMAKTKERMRDSSAALREARGSEKPARPPPTEEEILEAERIVESLALVAQASKAKERIGAIDVELQAHRVEIGKIADEMKATEEEIAKLPTGATISDLHRSALMVAEALAQAKANACAICGSVIPDHDVFSKRVANAKRKLDEGLKAQQERARLAQRLAEKQSQMAHTRRVIGLLEGEKTRLAAMSADLPVVADPDAARAKLSDLHSLRAAWDLVAKGEERALEAETEALQWSQLADALSIALGKLVDRARAGFESRVQAFLPDAWKFGVDLIDGEREVLRVGLRDKGTVRCALSGAEWATVTAALGLATAPENGPVVIAPEERAFDADTLADVMEAFSKVGDAAQVVLTSPIAPSRVVPGWTIIATSAANLPAEAKPAAAKPTVAGSRRAGPGRGHKGPRTEAAPPPPVKPAPAVRDEFVQRDGKLVLVKSEEEPAAPAGPVVEPPAPEPAAPSVATTIDIFDS